MKHRLMQERLTYIYKEEIDLEMKLRAKSARQLHLMILRLKQEQPEGEELEEISMRIGQLEADIANRSTVIQHRQGFLANAASGTCTSEDGEEGKEADNIDKVCLNSADYKVSDPILQYFGRQYVTTHTPTVDCNQIHDGTAHSSYQAEYLPSQIIGEQDKKAN